MAKKVFLIDEESLVHVKGGVKPLKEITTNDKVFSYNVKDNKVELKPVKSIKFHASKIKCLVVHYGTGENIKCSTGYPLGYIGKLSWVKSGDYRHSVEYKEANTMTRGLVVPSCFDDHKPCLYLCSEIETSKVDCKVCSLEVDGNHNFFVGSSNGILVGDSTRVKK